MFLEIFFSFCKFLKIAAGRLVKAGNEQTLLSIQEQACQVVHGHGLSGDTVMSPSYQEICLKPYDVPEINIGTETTFPLTGMRFFVVGHYPKKAEKRVTKEQRRAGQSSCQNGWQVSWKAR